MMKHKKEQFVKDYKILNLIGKGGMAAIYLVEHVVTKEKLALKVLLPHIADNQDFVKRFLHEVKANEKLNHKNIVKIKDSGEFDGYYFMAMEFVNGLTLQELLKIVPILPLSCALFFLKQILAGLQYSHSQNIIHRDIKPSNILISQYGAVKISDFGISKATDLTKLTQTGSILGTPAYMSPEQARGQSVDQRCDIFSTGIIFYEALSGLSPFASDNPSTTMFNLLEKEPELPSELNPTIPNAFEAILEKMIMKNRDERYSSIKFIQEDLEEYKKDIGEPADRYTIIKFMQNPRETAQELALKKSRELINTGDKLLKNGESFEKQVIWEYYKALYLNPGNTDLHEKIKQLCEKHGYNREPIRNQKIETLEKELLDNPQSIPLLMQIAKAHSLAGNFFQVIKYFKKLLQLKPDDVYIQGQMEALIGDKTLAAGMTTYTNLQPVTRQQIPSPRVASNIPSIEVVKIKPQKSKSTTLLPAIIVTVAVIFLGFIVWFIHSLIQSSSEMANIAADKIISSQKNKDPFQFQPPKSGENLDALADYGKAEEAFNVKDFNLAKELYQSIQKKYPEFRKYDVLYRLAQLNIETGDYDTALENIEIIISQNPDQQLTILALLKRINIFSIRKKFLDAEIDYENIMTRIAQLRDIEFRVELMLDFATFLRAREKYSRALEICNQVIEQFSGREFQFSARNLIADIYLDQGRKGDAVAEYRRILQDLSPDQIEYQETEQKITALE